MATTLPRTAVTDSAADRLLRRAAVLFALAVLVHNSDHLRRGGDSVSADVFWAGSSAMILEVGVVALALARHRLAPLAAATTGLSLALGYVVVHFTPERGWLSDSLLNGDASGLSIAAASFEVVAALTLGIAGLHSLNERGGLVSATRSPTDPPVPAPAMLGHPVVIAMIAGNVVIFVASLAGR